MSANSGQPDSVEKLGSAMARLGLGADPIKEDASAPVIRSYEEALKGKAGFDFIPEDRCAVCDRMAYFNGRRFVMEHDPVPHKADDTKRLVTEDGRVIDLARTIARNSRARRSTGERDDDDD